MLLILVFCFFDIDADASWLIDAERYHVSAHGQNSCQDCHSDIADKSMHPNPAEVNKTLREFFRLDQCTSCHEDVLEDSDEGSHGGEQIVDRQEFNFCIECHDPHYQLSYSDTANQVDLNLPEKKKCSTCHEQQVELPDFSTEDKFCMSCHRSVDFEDSGVAGYISNLCFHCHGKSVATIQTGNFPLIDTSAFGKTIHSDISCITCHLEAVEFRHEDQKIGDCRDCHRLHDEKIAHDLHLRVTCAACHLNQVLPVKESGSSQIQWQIDHSPDRISSVHSMISSNDEAFCRRCHFKGNSIGAVAMVLPAKSIMCMPCHAATFSVGDTTTLIALIFFGLGVLGAGSIWFSGTLFGETEPSISGKILRTIQSVLSVIFSIRLILVLKILILDGLIQRRLFRISRLRWFIHALIFFPFLIRFCWGLIALVGSIWLPSWQGAWIMLDKNHPLPAFLFDLTGILVVFGVSIILFRRYVIGSGVKLKGLPRADWPAYSLIGGIIIIGFVLDAMRIAMTGTLPASQYAFLGFVISRLFTRFDLTGVYGYVWYLHAIFTGAFLAYLPFSRMLHMIMAPVSLAINATSRAHGKLV